jgi:hypothetical protein
VTGTRNRASPDRSQTAYSPGAVSRGAVTWIGSVAWYPGGT